MPLLAQAQWSDPHDGTLIIRGGWLFDGLSDTRRRNSGIIIRYEMGPDTINREMVSGPFNWTTFVYRA